MEQPTPICSHSSYHSHSSHPPSLLTAQVLLAAALATGTLRELHLEGNVPSQLTSFGDT